MSFRKLGRRALTLALGGALMLPAMNAFAATTHTATDNDTFWTLSKKYNVPLATLMKANPKIDPLNIYQGLKITIPSGSAANAAKTASAAKSKTSAVTAKSVATKSVAAKSVTTASGSVLGYAKVIDMKASAYSAAIEENAWGAVDYFGNPLKLGTIAVDPKVIPFGTKVYITGYDFDGLPAGGMIATATDAGSAIVGNRIDIFIPGSRSYVSKFGFQNVKLYVLK
ncbi:3D domain-containing protein [Cohnella thailandensis]|uniref:LysM peptidoglycan-binding domain-containing protein n=1 Tax=Cohnella thailandensis TaxID=557557 RepID=A0A841SRH0_9BACL|nr:3D domain-containing protein [Cohnella thailandensis]MBB6632665.1 LysM peptidoglycan-binding domain-containing protein [Cohnella thailandensis]MBP1975646.1 3D (Asp-Asp-Asp) domain-containing protein [Cohnella thailandensis]